MAREREVAGLRCSEVLARLSDLVDGAVPPETAERIAQHLAGCNWCERFGGRFSAIVASLREQLREAEPPDPELVQRVLAGARRDGR